MKLLQVNNYIIFSRFLRYLSIYIQQIREVTTSGVAYSLEEVASTVFSLSNECIKNLTRYPENHGYVYFKYPYYKALMKSYRQVDNQVIVNDDMLPKTATLFKKYQSKKSSFISDYELQSVNCSIYRMLILEHCYDISAAEKLYNMMLNYYKITHYKDSHHHNIDHTKIISDDIFEKGCFLMDGLFDIHLETISDKSSILRKLCLVFGKVLVFYAIMSLIEKIGLFPYMDSLPWATKDRVPPANYDFFSFLIFCKEHSHGESEFKKSCQSSFLALLTADTYPYKYEMFTATKYCSIFLNWCSKMFNYYGKEYFKAIMSVDEDENYVNVEDEDVTAVPNVAAQSYQKKRKNDSSSNSPGYKRKKATTNASPSKVNKEKKKPINLLLKAAKKDSSCVDCQRKGYKSKATASIVNLKDKTEKCVCKHHATLQWNKYGNKSMKDDTDGEGLLTYVDIIYINKTKDPQALFMNIMESPDSPSYILGKCDENHAMCVECPLECSNGKSCKNQQVRKLRKCKQGSLCYPSTIGIVKGVGLFSRKKFKNGDPIIEYVGVLRKADDCNRILDEKLSTGDDGIYFMSLCNDYTIDAEIYGNDARFINHSCNPNAVAKKWTVSIVCVFVIICYLWYCLPFF